MDHSLLDLIYSVMYKIPLVVHEFYAIKKRKHFLKLYGNWKQQTENKINIHVFHRIISYEKRNNNWIFLTTFQVWERHS